MFPTQAGQPQETAGSGALEDRLRGLILNNATSHNANANLGSPLPPADVPTLPPHMLTATSADQQQYLDNMNTKASPPHGGADPVHETQQAGRKRMNQAQRRQMNSQLSFTIDTRQQHHQPGPSPHGFAPYQRQQQANRSPQYFDNSPQFQHNQRFNRQQQFSPQFPQPSPASPYHPGMTYQNSPRPGMHSNQSSPKYQFQNPVPQQQQQQQPHWHNINQTGPGQGPLASRPAPQNRQLYQPGPAGGQGRMRPYGASMEEMASQSAYLDKLAYECVPGVEIDGEEASKKEQFRALIEKVCKEAIMDYEQQELGNENFCASTVELKCYGSLSSGFATKGSDMDLALLTPSSQPPAESSESPIPRLLEKKLLSLGYGARLLTRTRVPIIKLCEQPTEKLLSDLLEERSKWENGFAEEHGEDGDEKQVGSPVNEHVEPSPKPDHSKVEPTVQSPCNDRQSQSTEKKQIVLKQKEHQPLNDYYNCVKRVLRKYGGRDLTLNSPELNLNESKILNDVCRAFILGLSSEELSRRLCKYRSISPLFDPSVPFVQRSLNGICTQIEGERLAMGWEERPVLEPTEAYESECLASIEAWKVLQDKAGPLTESDLYNRQLYTASERLKRINSLKLAFLEQMQYENPQQYLARVQRLKFDLEGKGQLKSLLREPKLADEELTAIVISRYIAGINNRPIREELESLEGLTVLKEVARRHQILQLANDYEHAIESHLYDESAQENIEKYVTILRDLAKGPPSNDASHAELLALIRTLPDPTQISLTKPRDRYKDHLEFPKATVGIQCDINFSNHLALHNTLLLRLYSVCDPRVKVMVLFIKHWAKVRGINTPYRGTLGSYGYVLMVLHYLINVVQPPVCPNLQHKHREPPSHLSPAEKEAQTTCEGHDVRFWRDETEIKSLAEKNMLTHNNDSVGLLLRGFFEYFAHSGQMTTVPGGARGFDWGREVLSLRSTHGIVSKQEKGWVGARTVIETTQVAAPPTPSQPAFSTPATEASETKCAKQPAKTIEEIKEVRHRYLFAIEDPFEIDHNIARTVTHNGIVSIRDEFRRAWGIIKCIGTKTGPKDGLLDPLPGPDDSKAALNHLLDMIHGKGGGDRDGLGTGI